MQVSKYVATIFSFIMLFFQPGVQEEYETLKHNLPEVIAKEEEYDTINPAFATQHHHKVNMWDMNLLVFSGSCLINY